MKTKTCPHCQKENLYIVENDAIHKQKELLVKIYNNKLLVEVYDSNGDVSTYETSITLCPMCGRALNNED